MERRNDGTTVTSVRAAGFRNGVVRDRPIGAGGGQTPFAFREPLERFEGNGSAA